MEGMPVATLASRKKSLVQDLNGFIAQKKALTEQADSIQELTQTHKKGTLNTRGNAGSQQSHLYWRHFIYSSLLFLPATKI